MKRKISFGKNGKGYISPKISLQVKELQQLKVNEQNPYVNIFYNEKLDCIIEKEC